MSLSAYALATLASASDYIGGVPEINGIWIYCSGATVASAEVTDTTLLLINTAAVATSHRAVAANVATIGTAAAHGLIAGNKVVMRGMADAAYNGTFTVVAATDTTHFTFALTHATETETADTGGTTAKATVLTFADAANDTITELVGVINALATGWTAGAICNGAAASTDLIVTGALSCAGSTNEQTLKIADNYGLTENINRASDFIERYVNRKIKTRSFDRVQYIGNGRELLVLNQYPVTRVFRVSEGMTNTFYVTNTTAKNFATVEVNATQLRLSADGTVTNLTLSTYATINLLIAAVNATSGWAATLVAEGTRAATYTGSDGTTKVSELIPMPAQRCMSPNVAYVQVPHQEIDDYWIMAGGGDEDRDAGMLMREGGWTRGETFYVDIVAGWTTIPAALEEACLCLVKYARDKQAVSGIYSSEGLGDYNYSIRSLTSALPPEILSEVNLFRAFEF